MTVKSYLRGYEIININGKWFYADTHEPTEMTYASRPCGHCGLHNTPEDNDACLGTLPGVMNACCGHGQVDEAYVQLLDGHCVRGADALLIKDILKKSLKEVQS